MGDTRELADPLVGSIVAGRYRILRRLAAGGMGVVYEATQEPLGRRVALKVIRGDAVDDPLARLRFEREAKTASSIQDPHVVVVHDFGSLHSTPGVSGLFLAMEFVEGQTLRAHLQQGRVIWRRSIGVVDHIARALAAAHAKGLVHRDLKPENVMLTTTSGAGDLEFFCKVLDFGLAKGIDEGLFKSTVEGQRLTGSGGFVGTPGYISPEHIDGASEDPRQDVYALGIVWWEMLTARHPFPAETPMKTLLRQMHEEPPALDDVLRLADGIPLAGAQLVRDMMARSPRDRPKDGAAVLDRLRELPQAPRPERGIDTSAPTLVAPRVFGHVDDIPPVRHSEAPTVDHHPRPAAVAPGETLVASTPVPASSAPHRRRPRRRLMALFGGCSVAGTIAGVALMRVVEPPAEPAQPAAALIVDAGATMTEVIIEGLSSFSAMRSLRDGLPPHDLRVYRPGRTELSFDGDVASLLADRLQGRVIEISGVVVVLEVKELDRGRVVVGAADWVDAGVVDAGAPTQDAGVIEMADAGAVPMGPDGLEP